MDYRLSVATRGVAVLLLVVSGSCAGTTRTVESRPVDVPPGPGWVFETGG